MTTRGISIIILLTALLFFVASILQNAKKANTLDLQTHITESGKKHWPSEYVCSNDDPLKWIIIRDKNFKNEYWFKFELKRPCQRDDKGVIVNNPPN